MPFHFMYFSAFNIPFLICAPHWYKYKTNNASCNHFTDSCTDSQNTVSHSLDRKTDDIDQRKGEKERAVDQKKCCYVAKDCFF